MYIRDLSIQNLKLLKDLSLSFVRPDGSLRMWTVIIGENGTGKTSILQAIAMAAAGQLQVNNLAGKVVANLRDRRSELPMQVRANFSFSELALHSTANFPELLTPPSPELRLVSSVSLTATERSLRGSSFYASSPEAAMAEVSYTGGALDSARAANTPLWFVAGYGVARSLPDAGRVPALDLPSIERMAPLFPDSPPLTSTAFANYFSSVGEDSARARRYASTLRDALFSAEKLLPRLRDLELRGSGGVRTAGDLQERNRFSQSVGRTSLKIPANALSHGYASTIAWIADLVGHILLEANDDVAPEQMYGLVLIDEIDLYLHPTWQVVLIHALRTTFPGLQFIVTTHSPLVLASVEDTDEIIRLGTDPESGDVVTCPVHDDPRLMTGTETYRAFFGIDDIYPVPAGANLRDYRYLAANPYRSDSDEQRMNELQDQLRRDGIDPAFPPVPRQPRRS